MKKRATPRDDRETTQESLGAMVPDGDKKESSEEFRQGVAKRFQELREDLGLTQTEAAQMAGTVLRSWQSYERAERLPGAEIFAELSLSGVNVNWLLTGMGPKLADRYVDPATTSPNDFPLSKRTGHFERTRRGAPTSDLDYLPIRRFEWMVTADGQGMRRVSNQRTLAFNVLWLQQEFGGNLSDLYLCEVVGDAMEPLLAQGDLVLFRVEERSREDGLYVIVQDDRLRVRRLQFFPGGRTRVVSDNKAYEAFDLGPDTPEGTVKIIGPTFWILKKL